MDFINVVDLLAQTGFELRIKCVEPDGISDEDQIEITVSGNGINRSVNFCRSDGFGMDDAVWQMLRITINDLSKENADENTPEYGGTT